MHLVLALLYFSLFSANRFHPHIIYTRLFTCLGKSYDFTIASSSQWYSVDEYQLLEHNGQLGTYNTKIKKQIIKILWKFYE